jgi:hypothetical protein
MIARRNEQFPPGDPPSEAQPVVPDTAPPVADAAPPAELDETARLLAASQAHNAELVAETLELKARVAQLEAPPIKWMRLKPACGACRPRPVPYENGRRWCLGNVVTARRRKGSRIWEVDFAALQRQQWIECAK